MKYIIQTIIIAGVAATLGLVSCSDSENRNLALLNQAKVVIDLGMPEEVASMGVLDNILRFFTRDAIARTAPAAFSLIKVRVTGPDIGTIDRDFAPYDTISLNVPAGNLRWFEVTAYVAPGDPSAALSFRGTAAANLPAGQTVSVPVAMGLNETKIVLPDPGAPGTPNYRIIQINDITGAGRIVKTGVGISFPGSFRPWDIDYDARGRIYIATNGFTTGQAQVIRINNINATSFTTIADNGVTGVVALAIDRPRDYVYYASTSALRRCKTDGTGLVGPLIISLGTAPIVTITGLDVDANGILYVSGTTTAAASRVFRYDPVQQLVTAVYATNLNAPEDVKVKAPYIYVANPGGANNYKIMQLNANLQFVAGYGSQATVLPNTNPGQFYKPRRFPAIRNDALIIIDDYDSPTDFDKLVSIRDMLGSGWATYPTTGDGQSEFSFFYGC